MSHRKATMQSLANALFEHSAIETGHLKAKELRKFAEPLITLSKVDTVANRSTRLCEIAGQEFVSFSTRSGLPRNSFGRLYAHSPPGQPAGRRGADGPD